MAESVLLSDLLFGFVLHCLWIYSTFYEFLHETYDHFVNIVYSLYVMTSAEIASDIASAEKKNHCANHTHGGLKGQQAEKETVKTF